MLHEYSRTELLIGEDGLKRLGQAKIIVFGIGGVGSYVVEGLARCGVGALTLVDNDCVSVTNINVGFIPYLPLYIFKCKQFPAFCTAVFFPYF